MLCEKSRTQNQTHSCSIWVLLSTKMFTFHSLPAVWWILNSMSSRPYLNRKSKSAHKETLPSNFKNLFTSMITTDPLTNWFHLTNTVKLSPIDFCWTDCWYCVSFPVGTCDISQIPLIRHSVLFCYHSSSLSRHHSKLEFTHLESTPWTYPQAILTRVMSVPIVMLPPAPLLT